MDLSLLAFQIPAIFLVWEARITPSPGKHFETEALAKLAGYPGCKHVESLASGFPGKCCLRCFCLHHLTVPGSLLPLATRAGCWGGGQVTSPGHKWKDTWMEAPASDINLFRPKVEKGKKKHSQTVTTALISQVPLMVTSKMNRHLASETAYKSELGAHSAIWGLRGSYEPSLGHSFLLGK